MAKQKTNVNDNRSSESERVALYIAKPSAVQIANCELQILRKSGKFKRIEVDR